MHEHGSSPRARQDGLLLETVGEELLLYDENNHIAHCLSPIAAGVWRHCDGERDVTELAESAGVSESLVGNALRELREKDLLAAAPTLMQSTVSRVSRREAIVRGVRVGAAAAAVPLIVSATAATPAMATSSTLTCKGTGKSADTCCICKFADGENCNNGFKSEAECKEKCLKAGGTFFEWAEESVCGE